MHSAIIDHCPHQTYLTGAKIPVIYSCMATLSEKIAHPTAYHHLSQLSVDIQLNGLIKCKEDSGVQMNLNKVILCSLNWIHLSQVY